MEHHGREMSCPHGNTARRKCSHCDAEDSERALAAADRLAEAAKGMLTVGAARVHQVRPINERYELMDDDLVRVTDGEEHDEKCHGCRSGDAIASLESALSAYLAERGR